MAAYVIFDVKKFWFNIWRINRLILVTRLDGTKYYLNPEMILTVEKTPDSVITLTNNVKFVVKDDAEEIVERFIRYQQKIHTPFTERE